MKFLNSLLFAHNEHFRNRKRSSQISTSSLPSESVRFSKNSRPVIASSRAGAEAKPVSEPVEADDWVLVELPSERDENKRPAKRLNCIQNSSTRHRVKASSFSSGNGSQTKVPPKKLNFDSNAMGLDKMDVELIQASWSACKNDPQEAGILLFRGLFTKFPQYLKFFPQFAGLDLDNLHENKRLVRHAMKVIETVTFVVDSIGDQTKADQLAEALQNLVQSHLHRNIGLTEFRNLGIVLIDFICDVNNKRSLSASSRHSSERNRQMNNKKSSSQQGMGNSLVEDDNSETMTSKLDKLRSLTSSSSSISSSSSSSSAPSPSAAPEGGPEADYNPTHEAEVNRRHPSSSDLQSERATITSLDTNSLVAAWTKLYGGVLDLVKSEEEERLK